MTVNEQPQFQVGKAWLRLWLGPEGLTTIANLHSFIPVNIRSSLLPYAGSTALSCIIEKQSSAYHVGAHALHHAPFSANANIYSHFPSSSSFPQPRCLNAL